MTNAKQMEWLGSVLSIVGAALLACHVWFSPIGWWFFLAANGVWIIYSFQQKLWGMTAMNLAFLATSLLGIYRAYTSQLQQFWASVSRGH